MNRLETTIRKYRYRLNHWWFRVQKRPAVRRVLLASMPGLGGLPLLQVLQLVLKDVSSAHFSIRASAMAYSFFLAFIPGLLFLFTLLPLFPLGNLESELVSILRQSLPADSYTVVESIVRETFRQKSSALLSLSFISVVLFAMRGVRTMLQAFRLIDPGIMRNRPVWREFIISLVLFFILVFILIAGVMFFVTSELVIDFLFMHFPLLDEAQQFVLHAVNLVIDFLILLFGVSVIYYVGPPLKKRMPFFNVGALTTTLLLVLAELGLKYYFAHFANYDRIFGSLGTIILLQIWFFYMSMVLLLGFEVNSAIQRLQYRRQARLQQDVY